ncbi:MAG: hypothetical protein R3247_12940, partial [Rhodothermales bacterium]|nr:hypothetical protein [Rhodothermales bacterium]
MELPVSRNFAAQLSTNWIINRRMDLLWFIGGALAAYGLFFLHAGLGWDMVGIWFLWVVLLDSPHFFGTFSRTYFDKQEFAQRRRLLLWSLLWFAAGPACILAAWGLYALGVGAYEWPWKVFLIFFGLWAYWHIVRQHYGFLRLYQKKNGETDRRDFRLDSALLYGGLILPFLVFIVRHPEVRAQLGLAEAVAAYPALPAAGRLGVLFDGTYLAALAWEHWVVALSAALIGTLAVAFLVRQLQKLHAGE